MPVTEAGARLGMVDLEDLEHPRLKAPPPGLDEVLAEETGKEIVREKVKEPQTRHAENADSLPSSSSNSITMEVNGRDM